MKYQLKFIKISLVSILITILFSCSEKLGDCDDDAIQLSEREATFTAIADSLIFTTINGCWISSISLDEMLYEIETNSTTGSNFTLTEDEFRIARKASTDMVIHMTENTTETERELIVRFQHGNCHDRVRIVQKAN